MSLLLPPPLRRLLGSHLWQGLGAKKIPENVSGVKLKDTIPGGEQPDICLKLPLFAQEAEKDG